MVIFYGFWGVVAATLDAECETSLYWFSSIMFLCQRWNCFEIVKEDWNLHLFNSTFDCSVYLDLAAIKVLFFFLFFFPFLEVAVVCVVADCLYVMVHEDP